jgi:hypothetical protein
MAAWRIARACQAYKCSPARAAKVEAALCLQAVLKGAAARKLVQQLKVQQQLLAELQQALQRGQQDVVQQAADQARQAGVSLLGSCTSWRGTCAMPVSSLSMLFCCLCLRSVS